jgi:hypothetical protein
MFYEESANNNTIVFKWLEPTVARTLNLPPQGLAVIFSHHQVCIKKKKEGHFLGGQKWKKSFGTFFRFKNGLVFVLPIKLMQISMFFADWLVYSGITLVFTFQAVWTTSYHTQFRFLRTKYQGEFSLVEGFKLVFLREIIYSSCQKIFLKWCLPIFPDWLR